MTIAAMFSGLTGSPTSTAVVRVGLLVDAHTTTATLARGTTTTGAVGFVARFAQTAITGAVRSRGADAVATISDTADRRRGCRRATHSAQACAMGSLTGALTCG